MVQKHINYANTLFRFFSVPFGRKKKRKTDFPFCFIQMKNEYVRFSFAIQRKAIKTQAKHTEQSNNNISPHRKPCSL